jgi:hypothetical protein
MFFHLVADPRLMPDVDRMKQLVDGSFVELRERALRANAAAVVKTRATAH